MKIVIDIPDEDYKFIKDLQFYHSGRRSGKTIEQNVINGIKNGKPYEERLQGNWKRIIEEDNDLISREALKNAKPEFMNEKVVRDTKYQTTKDRIYAKAWNACNSYWLNIIKNAPTVEITDYDTGYQDGLEDGLNDIRPQGEWITENLEEPYGKCNQCGEICEVDNYCSNCGADMRGDT